MPRVKRAMQFFLALFFVGAGLNHFLNVDFYVGIMPPYLPYHRELVLLSGGVELLLGGALLVPPLTRMAAWGLIALLIAVFPANIHMALNPQLYPETPEVALWLRLPLQGVFILWAYWYTRPARRWS